MADLKSSAQPAVSDLLQSDESQLYEQLGIRVQAIRRDPSISGSFAPQVTYDAAAMGPLDDLRDFGQRFFERFQGQAYNLICGTGQEDSDERKGVLDAFGIGKEEVAAAIAAVLVAQLAIVPAVASVVAALVVRLCFRPAYGAMCDVWKTKVPAGTS